MRIHIDAHRIEVLASDCYKVPAFLYFEVRKVVEKTAKDGNRLAQDYARATARRHGKWYPSAIQPEAQGLLTWVYGPLTHRLQGGMSFEHGSRNQPPHMDLARSADVISPLFERRVGQAVGKALSEFDGG